MKFYTKNVGFIFKRVFGGDKKTASSGKSERSSVKAK